MPTRRIVDIVSNIAGSGVSMSEPGRFSLEKLVSALPVGRITLIAALLTLLASCFMSRELLTKIPELVETSYSYDAQLRATVKNRTLETDGNAVTFIDVDEDALKLWSDASHTTPRRKVAELITKIAEKKPALIFVDFDLSGASSGTSDEALRTVLEKYSSDGPPLLLTREIETAECSEKGCSGDPCRAAVTPGGSRPSAFTALPYDDVGDKKPSILWVSSTVVPDSDGVVRSWRLWDEVCKGGVRQLWPSPQLAAAALAGRSLTNGKARLETYIKSINGGAAGRSIVNVAWPRNNEAREALIPFIIGGSSQTRVSDWRQGAGFRYQRVRASSVLADEVADSAFKDRAVVLGASYGSDNFMTPFGTMPGAALLANAIAVAPDVLDRGPVSSTLLTGLSLIVAACHAAIAKVFRAIPAAAIILTLSVLWLSVATHFMNPADAVATSNMALIMLGAFLTFDTLLEMAEGLHEGQGLGALLRKPKSASKHEQPEEKE